MGVTRTDLYTTEQNGLAKAAKAFAHPARVAIMEYLLNTNACCNGDLVEEIGLAQATISQHLRELKDIGIIQGTIEGARVSYCIDPKRWQQVQSDLEAFFRKYSPPADGDCC